MHADDEMTVGLPGQNLQEPQAEDDTQDVQAHEPEAERLSILGQLAEVRQEIKEGAEPLDLAVPGYKDLLWARFRPFPVARTERKVDMVQRSVRKKRPMLLSIASDTLIDACEQLMLKNQHGDLIPIDDSIPVGFDQRLAQLLKIPGAEQMTTARQVIMGLFPTEQAILRMSQTVNEWLQGELNEEADEDFLGESASTTQ